MAVEYDIDFRAHPEQYRYQSGEQGVFKVQPYKSELLPLWTFKDEAAAKGSSSALCVRYAAYRAQEDFVGMDMARKYLQMGFTRAMRYAKYPGGRKRVAGEPVAPQQWADAEKRKAALIFKEKWDAVRADPAYQHFKQRHVEKYEAARARGAQDAGAM